MYVIVRSIPVCIYVGSPEAIACKASLALYQIFLMVIFCFV